VENTALMQQCEQQQSQLSAVRMQSEALNEALKQERARSAVLVAERDAFQGEVRCVPRGGGMLSKGRRDAFQGEVGEMRAKGRWVRSGLGLDQIASGGRRC